VTSTTVVDEPLPEYRFRRKISLRQSLFELWQARELVRTLAERDFRVRYKQATLGFAWALLGPFALMIVFSLLFQRVARVDTGGVPYPLFSYMGILPWSFFSTSVSTGGMSVVTNKALLNKVYCPREVFPLASVGVVAADTLISGVVLLVLFARYGFMPDHHILWVPVLLIVECAFAIGFALIVSAVLVYARDLRHALPVLLQLGLFATPVAYAIEEFIPAYVQPIYALLNPLSTVIEGVRSAVLYGQNPNLHHLILSSVTSSVVLLAGFQLFKRLETRFADVA
jgi:ABC-type polysaccharide/polyol phosphate export permease